jgi:WD40 repeat protein
MLLSSVSDEWVGMVDSSDSTIQMWDCSGSIGVAKSSKTPLGVAGLTAFAMMTSTSFVVGDDEGGLHLYEWRGEEGWTYADRIGNHRHGITALLLLADGRLVSGSSNGTVAFWDLTREPYHKCVFLIDDDYHEDPVVAFHQFDDSLFILGEKGFSTWDFSSEASEEPVELVGYSGFSSRATCLTVMADGRVVIGTVGGDIELVSEPEGDRGTAKWDRLDGGHASAVKTVYALPDGSLVSLGADGALFLWNLETRQIVDALEDLDSEGSALVPPGSVLYYANGRPYRFA